MDTEYVLFFDYKQQQRYATSKKQALESLWGWVDAMIRTYLDSPDSKSDEQVWVDSVEEDGDTKNCSKCHAEYLLATYDEVELLVVTKNNGIWATAAVVSVEKHICTRAHDIANNSKNALNKTTIEKTKVIEELVKRLPTHDERTFFAPHDVNAIQILQAAENRLFAYHLYNAIQAIGQPHSKIDEQCDFADGTLYRLISLVDPMRPTPEIIDKLARCLKVKPEHLWIDLVKDYLIKTGEWDTAVIDEH